MTNNQPQNVQRNRIESSDLLAAIDRTLTGGNHIASVLIARINNKITKPPNQKTQQHTAENLNPKYEI